MSCTGLPQFDNTLQTTNIWLNELMQRMRWSNRDQTYRALRCVLHSLRDTLCIDEVAALGTQLPLLMRGIFYEGWDPEKNVRPKKDEFLSRLYPTHSPLTK